MLDSKNIDWRQFLKQWCKKNSSVTPVHLQETRDKFNQTFPKEKLGQLTIEQYGIGDSSFCHFLESCKKQNFGKKQPVDYNNHKVYGIYWNKKNDTWQRSDNFFGVRTPEEIFEEVIKIGLVKIIQAVDDKKYEQLDKIIDQYLGTNGHSLGGKTLYLYYHTIFLPIFAENLLNEFLDFFELSTFDSLFLKNLRLHDYLKSLPEFGTKFTSWGIKTFLLALKKEYSSYAYVSKKIKNSEQIISQSATSNTWMFQGNPSLFDLKSALSELDQLTWLVKQNKNQIHAGDRVFFWQSGNEAGILGTGIIISEPEIQLENPEERVFNLDQSKFEGEQIRVLIDIEEVFTKPIFRKQLLAFPELNNLSILRNAQGTNFPVTTEEADFLEKLISKTQNMPEIKELMPLYTWEQLQQETGYQSEFLERLERTLKRKKQIILTGCPGSGKTYLADKLAQYLTSESDGFIELIQFHPAYTYEDFMQGLRPLADNENNLTYQIVAGRFLEFCEQARNRQDNCVLIIDEINRANLAAVFGELMYLLEYRDRQIKLAVSNQTFSIPDNVYVIGTMNTADRSIALVDHALRRRFAFIELHPDYNILQQWHYQKQTNFKINSLIGVLNKINQEIGDHHYHIGISFFLDEKIEENIADIWELEIIPYLEEMFYGSPDKLQEFIWENVLLEIGKV